VDAKVNNLHHDSSDIGTGLVRSSVTRTAHRLYSPTLASAARLAKELWPADDGAANKYLIPT
jgi:hypothetical protein